MMLTSNITHGDSPNDSTHTSSCALLSFYEIQLMKNIERVNMQVFMQNIMVLCINHLCSNGLFFMVWYNHFGMIHCINQGVTVYNYKK